MKVTIENSVSTGHYSFHFTPEDEAEEFFLELLHKEDEEVFSPIHGFKPCGCSKSGGPTMGVAIPKKFKRVADNRSENNVSVNC